MKKRICVLAVVMNILCLLTACNFTTTSMIDNRTTAISPKVEEMMEALAGGNVDSALALMHPTVAEGAEDAVAEMCEYLAGRKAAQLNQKSVNVNTSTGTSGKSRQETATFQVELEDGTEIYISAAYRTDAAGEGFASFQIVLGVV